MLTGLSLQHFRSYSEKTLHFGSFTIVVGVNTAGKTNLVEAIMLLASGKSFRAQKDIDMITFEKEIARVKANTIDDDQKNVLEVVLSQGEHTAGKFMKKYLVNGVSKSRHMFVGYLPAVFFRPEELDIIIDGPSKRREFLSDMLEIIDSDYRYAKITYDKALRQRNALIDLARQTGKRNIEQFTYWDDLLITNGNILTTKREEFIAYINDSNQELFPIHILYDKSTISRERLAQYQEAEISAGTTLVGPQRDDFQVYIKGVQEKQHNVQQFGSRGQQRLAVLQLKLLQLEYVEKRLERKPLLILDDIFSELDSDHIAFVLEKVRGSQIILTTTHEEFITDIVRDATVIKLEK